MSDELVPIATFVRPAEAAAARLALEAQGITCFLKDDNLVGMNWLLGNAVSVKLLVSAGDAERALSVLDTPFDDWRGFEEGQTWKCRQCGEEADGRFEKCPQCGTPYGGNRSPNTEGDQEARFIRGLQDDRDEAQRQAANPYAAPRSEAVEAAEEDNAGPDDAVAGQACCPACGRPRVAVCPFCQTTGTRFRAADSFEAEHAQGEPALLICPTCDEPFEPEYLRRCEWCGHDFGEGVEPPDIVRAFEAEPLNWRVLLAGSLGVAVVAAIVIYFAVLLS